MSAHPAIERLRSVGFSVVPALNMAGGDMGVLAWRRTPVHLVVVTAWSDDCALSARLPVDQDWARPFVQAVGNRLGPASFADVVADLLRPRHQSEVDCAAAPGDAR